MHSKPHTLTNLMLIISREYLTRVKNKWFLLTTFLVPVGIIALMGISGFTSYQAANGQGSVLISDPLGILVARPDTIGTYKLTVTADPLSPDLIQRSIYKADYRAVVDLSTVTNTTGNLVINIYAKPGASLTNQIEIQSFLQSNILSSRIQSADFSPQQLAVLQTNVSLSSQSINESGQVGADYTFVSYILGYLSGIFIYMTLIIYGNMVMRGIIEEKTSRVVEIIISSARPIELMMGKILGIAAVSFTQIFLWITSLGLIGTIAWQFDTLRALTPLDSIDMGEVLRSANVVPFLFVFPFYYFGGYLLYSSIFGAIGSAVDSEKDSQVLVLPVTIPIIISFVLMFSVLSNPSSLLAVVLSMIPFTSPIIMMARLPFGVPWWEVVISVLILFGSFYATTLLAAKIYKTGILMYGKKNGFKELWKWMWV